MKKLYFLLSLIMLSCITAQAQQKLPITAVLTNGDTLYSNYIFINNNSTLFSGAHIRLDQYDKKAKIPLSRVETVSGIDQHGQERFFRKIYLPLYGDLMAERLHKTERVDLLYADIKQVSYGYGISSYNYRHYYFSKDNYPLQKLNMSNAKAEFGSSEESLAYLKKAQGVSITMGALLGTGIAMIVGGMAHTSRMNSDLPPGNAFSFSPLLFVGAITAYVPYFLRSTKYKHLENAAKVYR